MGNSEQYESVLVSVRVELAPVTIIKQLRIPLPLIFYLSPDFLERSKTLLLLHFAFFARGFERTSSHVLRHIKDLFIVDLLQRGVKRFRLQCFPILDLVTSWQG